MRGLLWKLTGVDSYSQFELFVVASSDSKPTDALQQTKGHRRYLTGVVISVSHRKSADHHVRVADCLHFVDVIMTDDAIEQGVKIVQEIDHLQTGKNHTFKKAACNCSPTIQISATKPHIERKELQRS